MARGALSLGGHLFASIQRARRNVSGPPHTRVAGFRAEVVVWHLDDLVGLDRLHAAAFAGRDGHVHPALHPHLRPVLDSTTFMRRGYGCCAKIGGRAVFLDDIAFAKPIIVFVLALRGSALFRSPFRKSCICCMKYAGCKLLIGAFSGRPDPSGR